MTLHIHLIGECPVSIWGLSSEERLRRVFARIGGAEFVTDLEKAPKTEPLLLLRSDYLFDERVLKSLVGTGNTLLMVGDIPVAATVSAEMAEPVAMVLSDGARATPEGLKVESVQSISSAYQEQLRKSDPNYVYRITEENRPALEQHLFNSAYKGITDLVTKWAWPVPAKRVVHWCVDYGIRPNHVTGFSWLLALLAVFLFAYGHLFLGLLSGWLMTFLDTVDGKLARVTVTSSKVGHFFDHILDILHPPFWYWAWGAGLVIYEPAVLDYSWDTTFWWFIFGGYLVGRAVEGLFQLFFGDFGIFSWKPLDSYTRLITARRNPCMVLLTLGFLADRPDLGFEAIALLTLLSSLFLILRFAMACIARMTSGPIHSWLRDVNLTPSEDDSLAIRWFARRRTVTALEGNE